MTRLSADVSMLLTMALDLREAVVCDEVPRGVEPEYYAALRSITKPDFNNAGSGQQEI